MPLLMEVRGIMLTATARSANKHWEENQNDGAPLVRGTPFSAVLILGFELSLLSRPGECRLSGHASLPPQMNIWQKSIERHVNVSLTAPAFRKIKLNI